MKYFFFLVLVITLSVTACKKDKDTNSIQLKSEDVVGTWNLTERTQNVKFGLGFQGQFSYTDFEIYLSYINMTVTFNANGTWTSSGTAKETTITKEEGEAPETDTYNITGGIGSGTYMIINGKLSMDGLEFSIEADTDEPMVFDATSFVPDSKLDIFNYIKLTNTDPASGLQGSYEGTTNFKFVQ
jgi:hypothetical protein